MLHTPLHRALGENPGPITDQMIDDAVEAGIEESDELDWKKALPAEKELRDSDIVKDIAAFANAAGGVIVFGVMEAGKVANGRADAGVLTESYERTIRKVCMAAITPPVFGVQTIAIPSATGTPAVALVIPASADGPHLIYRGDTFGAPLRTGADTHWMNERQLEAAYRSRFEGARRSEDALQQMYADLASAAGSNHQAVLVGAARPRTARPRVEPRDEVTSATGRALDMARWWLSGVPKGYGPLEDLDIYEARPTLAGQYLPPKNPGHYREAHAAIFDDGSVGLSWRAGDHANEHTGALYLPHQIPTIAVEAFAASLIALVHAVAADRPVGDFEVILGVEYGNASVQPPEFHGRNPAPPSGVHRTFSGRFQTVRVTCDPSSEPTTFVQTAVEVATSALNQVGIRKTAILNTMLPRRPSSLT